MDMFDFEYYGTAKILGSDNLIKNDWVSLEGGTVDFVFEYPAIGAGDHKIKVTFKGNSTHTNSSAETDVTINKAKVDVKVKTTNKFADEKLPEDFVTLSVDDKFDIYTVYGGVTSSLAPTAYLQISGIEESKFIEIIDTLLDFIGEETLTDRMQDGITLGELNDIVSKLVNAANTIPFFADFVKSQGIDLDALIKLTEVIGKLPDSTNDIKIALGEPNIAGLYTVFAVANNPNYETGVGMGMLLVKMRMSGTKLIYNQDIPSKITVEQAKTYDFTADVWHDGVRKTAEDGAKVKYLYSGLTSKWRLYSSTTTPPTEPGRYTQTIVTLGGNYQAAPLTRAFQIVK